MRKSNAPSSRVKFITPWSRSNDSSIHIDAKPGVSVSLSIVIQNNHNQLISSSIRAMQWNMGRKPRYTSNRACFNDNNGAIL